MVLLVMAMVALVRVRHGESVSRLLVSVGKRWKKEELSLLRWAQFVNQFATGRKMQKGL